MLHVSAGLEAAGRTRAAAPARPQQAPQSERTPPAQSTATDSGQPAADARKLRSARELVRPLDRAQVSPTPRSESVRSRAQNPLTLAQTPSACRAVLGEQTREVCARKASTLCHVGSPRLKRLSGVANPGWRAAGSHAGRGVWRLRSCSPPGLRWKSEPRSPQMAGGDSFTPTRAPARSHMVGGDPAGGRLARIPGGESELGRRSARSGSCGPQRGRQPAGGLGQSPDFCMALTANRYRTAEYSPTSLLPALPSSR